MWILFVVIIAHNSTVRTALFEISSKQLCDTAKNSFVSATPISYHTTCFKVGEAE